jgi:hypothetical protein
MRTILALACALATPLLMHACSGSNDGCPAGEHQTQGGGTGFTTGCCPAGYDNGCCEGDGACCSCATTASSSSSDGAGSGGASADGGSTGGSGGAGDAG